MMWRCSWLEAEQGDRWFDGRCRVGFFFFREGTIAVEFLLVFFLGELPEFAFVVVDGAYGNLETLT